jgi:hypothetical protein
MTEDEGVVGVVAAILLVAGIFGFLAVVRLSWLPVWASDAEAQHSDAVRSALASWADEVEDRLASGAVNQTFSHAVPAGARGLSIPLLGSAPDTTGVVSLEASPTLTVSIGGSTLLTASGRLDAALQPSAFPPQTLRYALGALEVNQSSAAWVDLRGMLQAERASGGLLQLSVLAPTLTGGAQGVASVGPAHIAATVTSSSTTENPAGTVRVLVEGIPGDAWRAAADRTLHAASLTGETAANCAASSRDYCFQSATNDADTMDLYVLDVAPGWTATRGDVAVEVRA